MLNKPTDEQFAYCALLHKLEEEVWHPNKGITGLHQFAFTWAIISGCDSMGYEDRWCYHSRLDASLALKEWMKNPDMKEPDDWHRHPFTFRYREADGDVYVKEPGREPKLWEGWQCHY